MRSVALETVTSIVRKFSADGPFELQLLSITVIYLLCLFAGKTDQMGQSVLAVGYHSSVHLLK